MLPSQFGPFWQVTVEWHVNKMKDYFMISFICLCFISRKLMSSSLLQWHVHEAIPLIQSHVSTKTRWSQVVQVINLPSSILRCSQARYSLSVRGLPQSLPPVGRAWKTSSWRHRGSILISPKTPKLVPFNTKDQCLSSIWMNVLPYLQGRGGVLLGCTYELNRSAVHCKLTWD